MNNTIQWGDLIVYRHKWRCKTVFRVIAVEGLHLTAVPIDDSMPLGTHVSGMMQFFRRATMNEVWMEGE